MKSILNKRIVSIAGFVFLFFLWEMVALLVGEEVRVFPGPLATIVEMFELMKHAYVYKCLTMTLGRMLLGFTLAFVLALFLGLWSGLNDYIEILLRPTITALKALPTASLVFLFLVVAGVKMTPVFIVLLISFPILYEGFVYGIKNIPVSIINALRLEGRRNFLMIKKIILPLAFPYVLMAVASSFALSFKIAIMAEVISGDTRLGLGSAILSTQKNDPSNMVRVFAYSMLAILLVIGMDKLMEIIKKTYIK